MMKKIWPVSPWVIVSLLPLLPTSYYLNRGYTKWFHLLCVVYFLTRAPFLRKVLILQGFGICIGWYTAIIYDYLAEGTWCHTLYRNMPDSMIVFMIQEDESCEGFTSTTWGNTTDNGVIGHGDNSSSAQQQQDCVPSYQVVDTFTAIIMKLLSHILDIFAHPGILYLLCKIHTQQYYYHTTATAAATTASNNGSGKKEQGTMNSNNMMTTLLLQDVITWPVIITAWHMSRLWSIVHTYINNNNNDGSNYGSSSVALWYYGYHVYKLNDLNSYLASYVAEGTCFVIVILYRMYVDNKNHRLQMMVSTNVRSGKSITIKEVEEEEEEEDSMPTMIHSTSCISTSSIDN